ncbi:MAG: ABC transporter ATP-binding protein [Eubacteriales bacterium]|nr:ABC transporter ATP-binding protein [Eubacteriales bacterium]
MFSKVLEYTGDYRRTIRAATLFLLAGVFVNVLPFWLIYQLIIPLLARQDISAGFILIRLGAIVLCLVLYAVFYVHGLSLSHEAAYHTLENLRVSLQGRLEKLPLGVIQEKGVGTVKKMFLDDIDNIELLLAHAIPEGAANLAIPLAVFLAMFLTDWKLAFLSLLSLPPGILAMGAMYQSGMSKMDQYYQAAAVMNNTIVEYINGMEVVKVFNRDGESYRRFESSIKNYRDFTLDWYRVCWPWMALYNSVLPCTAMFTLPAGAWLVLKGYSSLPHLVLVLCMSFAVGAPLLRAISFMASIPQVAYKIESLEKLMSEPPLIQTNAPFSGNDHQIAFQDVRFSYGADEVLHGVSLQARPGTMTALVGESGSGKSTLARLLVHFYDVSGGSISIGGQDIRSMSLETLNQQISFVSQEQFLFHMSLLENIRLGRPDATDQEVLAAAEAAQCGSFLDRLEHGIHTMAEDGGKQLSGGERQRISLARAILKDAPIVVLDEATAFIDPENEEKMNAAIARIIRGKTVIVIAHRLSSIANADQICVLKEGRVAGCGTHQELLSGCPEYEKLWQASLGSAGWAVSAGKEEA